MTAVRSARRISMVLAVISAMVAAIPLATASSAAAAPGRRAAAAIRASTTLPTLVAGVEVFSSPSMASRVAGKMRASGTSVSVNCWTTGLSFAGDPIWYSITAPRAGYVPAYDMAAHVAPVSGVPHCSNPAFGRIYHSLALNLKIRSLPSLNASVLATLGAVGTPTNISCFVTGSAVMGDSTWYYATTPAAGYMSGRFLNTGGDPAWGVPHC